MNGPQGKTGQGTPLCSVTLGPQMPPVPQDGGSDALYSQKQLEA